MNERCLECERLWHEYAQATNRHIQLAGKLRVAQLEGDRGKASALDIDVTEAEKTREAAREAIREHESKYHPQSAGLAEGAAED